MKTKTVERVLPPAPPHMVGDGFRVHNFFPGGHRLGKARMSPFYLLDYGARIDLPPSETERGVGPHPHRGFETVTIAYHGRVAHHDSAGNHGIIGEGDVQWMTAGSGVLHKEYQEREWSRQGGPFQMVQLWVNLPARHKMTAPKYQAITRAQMGRHVFADGRGSLEVLAGEFRGVKGPASTFTPVHIYNLYLKAGAEIGLELPERYNTGLLVIEGEVDVNEQTAVPRDHFVLFGHEGEAIGVRARTDSTVLVLGGEPIDEPIESYGPFLMNTQQELVQAVSDYNQGKFGDLE